MGNAVYANGPVDADHTAGKLIKIGARIVRNGRYVMFQLAEVAVPRALFAAILRRIERPLLPPVAPPVKADIVPLG